MHKLSAADELAETRAEIARLKLREAALRQAILAGEPVLGRWHRVEVTEHQLRIFDAALLPPKVRDNPAYWRERLTQVVKCLPVQAKAVGERPGWPIQRAPQGAALH